MFDLVAVIRTAASQLIFPMSSPDLADQMVGQTIRKIVRQHGHENCLASLDSLRRVRFNDTECLLVVALGMFVDPTAEDEKEEEAA